MDIVKVMRVCVDVHGVPAHSKLSSSLITEATAELGVCFNSGIPFMSERTAISVQTERGKF